MPRAQEENAWRDEGLEDLAETGLVDAVDVAMATSAAGDVPGRALCNTRTQLGREFPDFCNELEAELCTQWLRRGVEIGVDAVGDFAQQPGTAATELLACSVEEFVTCSLCAFWPVKRSNDPNEKTEPETGGGEGYVPKSRSLKYRVNFENIDGTGPAALVQILDTLDPSLNPGSFRVGNIGIGNHVITVPDDFPFYQDEVELPDSPDLLLRISVFVNSFLDLDNPANSRNEIRWSLSAVGSETGNPPTDVNVGFLPLSDETSDVTGRGHGWVEFTVDPRPGPSLITGIVIRNEARIVFDANPPITTNRVEYTIDADAPSSSILGLPAETPDPNIPRVWEGGDIEGGSGIAGYTLYVSTDNGPFLPFDSTLATAGSFRGEFGRTYGFYSVARDHAGNEEPAPSAADSVVKVLGGDPFRRGDINGDGEVTIVDPLALLYHLFLGSAAPACAEAADTNDDDKPLDIADVVFLLQFLYLNGDAPPTPGPFKCGSDPGGDTLGPCDDPSGSCNDA